MLNETWAERFGSLGIHFQAMHPGWASTPGVDASLPTFAKVIGPLLHSPEQGADTLVWLAANGLWDWVTETCGYEPSMADGAGATG